MRRRWARWTAAAALVASMAAPRPAAAWDPSTTHLGMLERSVLDSEMHVRWMEASLLQRGLFSPLRLDPARLDDETRRILTVALRNVHAASGAEAMGGPGSCPGPSAPASTRARCVDGDRWEMTALGWLELGVIVETSPAERLLHHFVDRTDPSAAQWSDDDLGRVVLRSKHAKVGATVAERITGAGFEGSGRSALAWLEDPRDRWAPPALARHLERASLAETAAERDHHLVLALLCTGALLHVMQDLSVPAHARGDVSALFLPLSEQVGDRGLPLQELARDAYGRGRLPAPVALEPRAGAEGKVRTPLAASLRGHVLGEGEYAGLVFQAGRTFLSESSVPAPVRLDPALDPVAAATVLLDGARLDAIERDGARLSAWPAERGYVLGASGRALAAFRVDDRQVVHLWLDRHVYRTQMQQLIPAGIDAGRSVLDLVYAAWPPMTVDLDARAITLEPGPTWADATLRVLLEDAAGRRTAATQVALTGPHAVRVEDGWPASRPEGSRVVLVLDAAPGQLPAIAEYVLDPDAPSPAEPGPRATVPRPRPQPPSTRPSTAKPARSGPKTGLVEAADEDDEEAPRGDAATPASDDDEPTPDELPNEERGRGRS